MASPLTEITDHPGKNAGISLYVKRDDLLHLVVAGNKWRKLEPVIQKVQRGDYEGILTFGGAFSNHIQAVAAAGQAFGFPTAAIVRGLYADLSNPTLSFAQSCGMELFPVSKQDYDAQLESAIVREVVQQFPSYCHVPEGGATPEAIRNCAALAQEILEQTDDIPSDKRFVALPAGTGSTAAGVIGGLGNKGKVVVFPAASYGVSAASIQTAVEMVFKQPCAPFDFQSDYVFGGFARHVPELIDFIRRFREQSGILLDPIYTSKMMWGVFDLLRRGYFNPGSTVVAVHTGGLQGWKGFLNYEL